MKRKAPRRTHVPPNKHPTVVQKRLRKHYGWADNVRHEIQIDAALNGRGKLEAMVHEWMHLKCWALPEGIVRELSRALTAFLHKNHVRIIEPGTKPLDFGP